MARLGGMVEDRVREVMGRDNGGLNMDRKRQEADRKRAYGDELQQQIREAQERKQRERDERFGRVPAPVQLQAPGHGAFEHWSPGHMAGNDPSSPSYHAGGVGSVYAPPADVGMQQQQQQQYAPYMQQPSHACPLGYGPPQPQEQQWGNMPGRVHVQQYGAQSAAAPQPGAQGSPYGSPSAASGPDHWGHMQAGEGSPPHGGYSYAQQSAPGGQGYGAAPAVQYGFQQQQQQQQQGSPSGYYAGASQQAPGPYAGSGFQPHQQQHQQQSNIAARAAAQQRHGASDSAAAAVAARKAAYRAELEAQMRDKVERKQQEKLQQQQEDRRKEAEVAAYNPWGRAGAGAPMRDGNGRVVTDLKKMRSMRGQEDGDGGGSYQGEQHSHQQQQQQQQQQPGGAGYGVQANANGWGHANSSPPNGYGAGMQQQQYNGQMPGGNWGDHRGNGNDDEAGYGGPAPQQAQQQQQQAPTAAGAPPILNFRSDKAFQTANELERRARAQQELQDALAAQIEDKKRRKEAEERKEKEEEERELARLAREQALLQAQFEAEQQKQKAAREKADDADGKVAEAWSNANKVSHRKRGSAGGEPSHDQDHQQPFTAPATQPSLPSAPAVDEQALQERARQAAAEEMARLREEMAREAAALREAMAAQQHEVTALRAAAAAAEQQSSAAKGQVEDMRRDMVRRSQEAAHETFATILADPSYGPSSSTPKVVAAFHPAAIRETTLNLDLPPPAPVLRRALQQAAVRGLEMSGAQETDDPFDAFRMRSVGPQEGAGPAVAAGPSGRSRSMPSGVRESLLVSDSTFIFPSGFQPSSEPGVSGAAGAGGEDGLAPAGAWGTQHSASPSGREQQQQPGALQPSTSYGRTGLSTPLDVAGVYSRNEDKLRFLSSVNRAGDNSMEALDQFLATYANSVPQFKERRTYTPPTGLGGLGASSINARQPAAGRRSSSAHAPGLPPMRDTLDTEMYRLDGLLRDVQPPTAVSMLKAGAHRVEASEHSMASSSHWVKTALQ